MSASPNTPHPFTSCYLDGSLNDTGYFTPVCKESFVRNRSYGR